MSAEIVPSPKKEPAKKKTEINVVQKDGVLKELEKIEDHARDTWKKKWGFYSSYDKMCCEQAERLFGLSEQEFRDMVHRKRCREKGRKTSPVRRFFTPTPSGAFPRTSSGVVGWRSARPECSLEYFGRLYNSPTLTIEPPDNNDRDPPKHQRCIMLG